MMEGSKSLSSAAAGAGETSDVAAAREFVEEAGSVFTVEAEVFVIFPYENDSTPHCYPVSVHLAEVKRIASDYPDKVDQKKALLPLAARAVKASQSGLGKLADRSGTSALRKL